MVPCLRLPEEQPMSPRARWQFGVPDQAGKLDRPCPRHFRLKTGKGVVPLRCCTVPLKQKFPRDALLDQAWGQFDSCLGFRSISQGPHELCKINFIQVNVNVFLLDFIANQRDERKGDLNRD
jgi:hypothetical protein